jgi:hypothetical protein
MGVLRTWEEAGAGDSSAVVFDLEVREKLGGVRAPQRSAHRLFPAAESRLPNENLLNALYIVVRKTKKQTTALLNTQFSCEACAREAR